MSDKDSPQPDAQDEILQAVEDSEPDSRDAEPEAVVPPPPQAAPPAPPPAPPPPHRRSGALLGGVIGAVLALGGGYAALRFAPLELLPQPGASALDDRVAANTAEISTLKSQIAGLPAPGAVDPALVERIAALEAAVSAIRPAPAPDLSGLEGRIAELETKVAALSAQPAAPVPAVSGDALSPDAASAIAALQAEVTALKAAEGAVSAAIAAKADAVAAQLQAAQTEARNLAEAAASEAQSALARAALSRLQAALDSGVPYAGALADLGLDPVPEALAAHAETGVPTLQALTDSFPDAARAALDASLKAQVGAGWTDRVLTFLRTETGIRSLDPRDGTDPDAILSRAEAAVQDGRLAEALAEVAGLPPEGQAALQPWVDLAKTRIEATAAATQVATELGRG